MMKYAIISDIHGNITALNAVIEDIKKQNIDRTICLGDIISKGSHGHECVDLVRKFCDACVRGNNDISYTKSLDELASNADFDYEYFMWTQKQLTTEDINYIRRLPLCCEFMLSGRLVRCFHASPESEGLSIFAFDNHRTKLSLFQPTEFTTKNVADVVVYGHTHASGYEKLFGYTLINSGSVGNSLNLIYDKALNNTKISEYTMAEYVVLSGEDENNIGEISIEFRSVMYDKAREIEDFNFYQKKDLYIDELKFGAYRFPERVETSLKNSKN